MKRTLLIRRVALSFWEPGVNRRRFRLQARSLPYPVWLPDGSVLLADNATLYRWRHGETSWTPVAVSGRSVLVM